jgi:hypothetical protein
MIFTRILFVFDILVAIVVVGFFVVGLGDGSVSSFNGGLWFGILAALAVIIGGSWALQANGQRVAAIVVLLILAVPALLYVLFFAMLIIMQPRWN